MIHRDAIRLVEQYGGRATHSVSGSTTMLVIGEEGWPLEDDGGASQKLQQVMQMIADGSKFVSSPNPTGCNCWAWMIIAKKSAERTRRRCSVGCWMFLYA
jgi:hypothetical protein